MTIFLSLAVAALIVGAAMALWPQRRVDAVDKRISEGDDRHFEEQRSYAANPKLRDPGSVRKRGLIIIALGMSMLAMWYAGALDAGTS